MNIWNKVGYTQQFIYQYIYITGYVYSIPMSERMNGHQLALIEVYN